MDPTDTEVSSVFIKNKKYLQPNSKYKLRKCKPCDMMIAENYLTNHKRTLSHLSNQLIYDENINKNNVEFINNKLMKEIDELTYKLNDLCNHKEKIKNDITESNQQINHMKHHIIKMGEEYNIIDSNIKKITEKLNNNKIVHDYLKNN